MNTSKISTKSTKKKIAACINRKAKQLGCTPGKKAKASEPRYIDLSTEQKQLYSSNVFAATMKVVQLSIDSPGLELFPVKIED